MLLPQRQIVELQGNGKPPAAMFPAALNRQRDVRRA